MQSFSKKEDKSFTPSFVTTCSSTWNCSTEHAPSKSTLTGVESKKPEPHFQDQDSTSTLSTGQSNHGEAAMPKSTTLLQNIALHPGWDGIYEVQAGTGTKASLSGENATNTLPMAYLSYPWADTYFGKFMSSYGSNATDFPQMMGVMPTRVALPPECTESFPIFVNAKQYRAILKRREVRAKLEAQNKLVKDRKPYLHESRHRHAMKRARGSGGRFLNTKKIQKLKPQSPKDDKNIFKGEAGCRSMVQHSESGSSTQSGSDVTSIFGGDDIFRVFGFPFHMQEAEEEDDFMHGGT